MQSQNGMAGMNGQSLQDMQQRLLQQQQQQMHIPQAQMMAGNQFSNGMNAQPLAAFGQQGGQMSNPALSMMHQQANTQSNAMMTTAGGMNTNNNMMAVNGNWNTMAPSNVSQSPMDASSGSSARLMASMGVGGMTNFGGNGKGFVDTSNSSVQNMQVLFQQQQQAQAQKMAQQQPQVPNPVAAVRQISSSSSAQMVNPNAQTQQQQMMLQRQLASMQNHAQGMGVMQQQGNQAHCIANPQGSVTPSPEFLHAQQQQQQLYQQMKQQQHGMAHMHAPGNNNDMMAMMQQSSGMGHQQPVSMTGSLSGGGLMTSGGQMHRQTSMESVPQGLAMASFNEQHLRAPQMTMQDSSQLRPDNMRQQQSQQLTNQNVIQHQQEPQRFSGGGSVSSQQGSSHSYSTSPLLGMNPGLSDSSVRSHPSSGNPRQDNTTIGLSANGSSDQKAFLDGSFAGGWQSNADLPDRREVIFRILEVIRHMRPDTDRVSSKLPHMAKSLEEHLYRSAQTKEEYMDFGTLRRRLQAIAHGLELHRPSSSASQQSGDQSSQTQPMASARNQGRSSFQDSSSSDSGMYSTAINSNQDALNASMNSGMGMGSHNQSQMSSHMQQMGEQMNHSASFGSSMGGNASAPLSMGNVPQRQTSSQFQKNSSSGSADYGGSMVGESNMTTMPLNGGFLPMGGMSLPQQQQMQSSMMQQQQPMSNMMPGHSQMGSVVGQNINSSQASLQNWTSQSAPFWDSTGSTSGMDSSMQKKKVILQQQQRLLLLRHASKCTAGAACQTRFCSQMVTLWRHMKACRDKNCKTPHCVSSRCVLNHYRICKSNGNTASCEVCGPVMLKINQKDTDAMSSDPLTRDQDPSMKQKHQAYQQQSLQPQGVGQMSTGLMNQNIMQPLPMQQQSSLQPGASQHVVNSVSEGIQLQQAKQQQQLKLKQQLESLKQLQKKHEELEKQQKRLEMHAQQMQDPSSPQAQQLQQQQMLLRHLQKKCQQQQLMLQQEVKMLLSGGANPQQDQVQMSVQAQVQQQQFQQRLIAQQQGLQGTTGLVAGTMHGVQSSNSITDGKFQGSSSRKSPVTAKPRYTGGKGRRGGKGKTLAINSAIAKKRPNETDDESLQYRKRSATTKIEETSETISGERNPSLGAGLDETSLIPLMTRDEIIKHLESLNKRFCLSSRTVTHKCMPIIQGLIDDQFGWVFHDPVDPVTLGLPDYFDVVKTPMCLELVKKKLENAIYNDTESFARDLSLVFENAILYNGESSEVGELAKSMLDKFHASYRVLIQELESSYLNLEKKGELCSLCGNQNRKFEPTVLYCQGDCKMQQIKRHTTYFTDRAKQNNWCEGCFKLIGDDQLIMLDDGTEVRKSDLQECKNDALPKEGWVNCDHCNSWVHQVCSLFNGRVNKTGARYTCPNCYLSKGNVGRAFSKQIKVAADLPHCKMSEAIESGLLATLEKAYKDKSDKLGLSVDDVEKAEFFSIRVVSNTEKRHLVGEEMLRRYKDEGCVKDYPVRTKCIALFQKIHGADTLLFAMYVYEYGHECPAPNRRRVYVSYLDSVQYFEPKCYRTLAYHTVLVEYLRYVKSRGFHTAHFWSCPPTPGDDYIFHVHPSHQLVPREDMLRAWYHGMLDRAKAEGIVVRTTNLYDEYFVKGGVDSMPWATGRPTCLPYFEGDYIPGEIESIIKLEREKNLSFSSETRGEDTVMTRLSLNLHKMKENFIVAHLRSRRFAAAVESGDDVSEFKDASDEELDRSKRAKISSKDSLQTKFLDQGGSLSLEREPALQAITSYNIDASLSSSSEDEQPRRSSELHVVCNVENSEQVPETDAAVVATETMQSPCTVLQDEISANPTDTRDQTLPILGNSDSPTKDMDLSNGSAIQLVETNETLKPKEPPTAASSYDGGEKRYCEPFSLEGKPLEISKVEKQDDASSQADKKERNHESNSLERELTTTDKEVDAESRTIASALVERDEKTEENVDETSVEDRNQAKRDLLLPKLTTDPDVTHDGQASEINHEKIDDSAVVDLVRVRAHAFEDNEKEAPDIDIKEGFADLATESKQSTQDDDATSSMNVRLGLEVHERGRGPEQSTRENDVLDETSRNDDESLLSRPADTKQVTVNNEPGGTDNESVDRTRAANSGRNNEDEAEALDVKTDVVITSGLEVNNNESLKNDSVVSNKVKATNEDSLVSDNEEGRYVTQGSVADVVKGFASNADSSGENEIQPQIIGNETRKDSSSIEEKNVQAIHSNAVKGGIITAVVGETVSTIDQMAEVDNGKQIITSEIASDTLTPGLEILTSDSVPTTSSDRAQSRRADQASHSSSIDAADNQLPNQGEENLERPNMIKDVSTTECVKFVSQAEGGIEEGPCDRDVLTSTRDGRVFDNVQTTDTTHTRLQLSFPDADDQGPAESIGTSSPGLLKRGIDEVKPLLSRHFDELNLPLKFVTDTADPDEPIEVELFESRQRFLNYCQSSHCQFDELRRAKHSTMMVLFQLHNPAAPLFLQQCGACYRDITHGVRYSCNNCSKFDLCEDCYKPVTSGLWAKRDSRFEHDLSHTFTPIDMEVSIDSALSQEDRQKALKAHCALLEHAGDCPGPPACSLQNCQKMKKLFNHVRTCEIKPKSDCRICTRLISLCAIHARTCKIADSCPVPFCDRIRDRNKRLQRQQQLMDDRRRQAQNDLYHMS